MPEYQTFENQRIIETNKVDDPLQVYSKHDHQGGFEALNSLTPNAFKLWYYMNSNAHGYVYALSRAHCTSICGMSKNTYRKAFNELVECGYLVETRANYYRFFEVSQNPN